MPFPYDDSYWTAIRSFLEKYTNFSHALLAPNDFLEFFPGTYPYNITYTLPATHFDFIVLHKGMLADIEPFFLVGVLRWFRLVFVNDVFIIYARKPPADLTLLSDVDVRAFLEQFLNDSHSQQTNGYQGFRILVTTRNSPQNLERSLPQLFNLGAPIVIVDDGSTPDNHQTNQHLCDRYQIPLLHLPHERGTPAALNMGISYWLADPQATWISYFRDNVEVHPEILTVLCQIQDPTKRPLLTGRDAAEHLDFGEEAIAGYQVRLKRSVPGIHLHAHRDYWKNVLPIPTPDLKENRSERGTEEDWWITAWSPQSITKRGGYVICVPGLIRTVDDPEDSSWGAIRMIQPEPERITYSIPVKVPTPAVLQSSADGVDGDRPTPHAPLPDLTLDNIRVLVDGYNLQLTKGTGIKTYGTSLLQALNLLGAQVDILLSRGGYKNNPVLDEVYFFDNPKDPNLFTVLKGLIKTSSGPLYRAKRKHDFSGFVVKKGQYSDDFLKYASSFNLPQCYDIANVLYKKLKIKTAISISEPVHIWHATYPLPMEIRGAKKITTIHDLIPLRLPYATLDDKENFYFKVRDALKESAVVISVSEHSKQDLLAYFDVDPDKIVVTYQPIALQHGETDERKVCQFLQQYGLEFRKFILFVGAIEPKKNVGRLLDAYASIDTDMSLVIVGKKGWLWEDEIGKVGYLFDKAAKKKVKLLEYISTSALKYLYQGAYCLVFPSLYEGFGLPPLEAMTFGCPVIASNVSSLPEICGNAALYVDPYDVGNIRQQLETLLSDTELRNQLAETGKENAEFFSMENYVKRLYKAYTKTLET
jgi:glycosyltransferase involved in cell wall biosynthesis